jgi:hypothetical protein
VGAVVSPVALVSAVEADSLVLLNKNGLCNALFRPHSYLLVFVDPTLELAPRVREHPSLLAAFTPERCS